MKPTCTALLASVFLCIGPFVYAQAPASVPVAARLGDATAVAGLLVQGADSNAADSEGLTALHWAAQRGDFRVVELLLAAGADAQARDARGRTPLHHAAIGNNKQVLKALLEHGSDANAVDCSGDAPLHVAARRFKADAVAFLIAAGAEVDAANNAGQTALHVLGADAREEDAALGVLLDSIAHVMIAAGGDPALRDSSGQVAWPHEVQPSGEEKQPSGYPTYDEIASTLLARASSYPTLCRRIDLGATAGPTGWTKRMYALEITSDVGVPADKPKFKYVSTMHGDEVVGAVMCLNLIDYLLTNYGSVPRVTNIVDSIDIFIVPCMNPYGYTYNTRYNYNGYDLNRSFPEGSGPNPDANTTTGKQLEVATIMNWGFANNFVLAANFHGGALVANYPFDNDNKGSVYSACPDDDLYIDISERYSIHNSPMWNSTSFTHGITNGADWYAIDGGMQDWDYRYQGCHEITIELGNTKSPAYSTMPTYWSQNQESMLSYMESCLIGVRGIVTDAGTGAPLLATITVVGRDHPIYSDPNVGNYHRMLLPGNYQLQFTATGYQSQTIPVTVSAGDATRLDVALVDPNASLQVTPAGGLDSAGNIGGPFTPGSIDYTVRNGSGSSIDYQVTASQPWLSLTNASGSLAPGATVVVAVSINSGASSLSAGTYTDSVNFTNTTNGQGSTTRAVTLNVGVPGIIVSWNMDTDPGWSTQGSWAYGKPNGLGSHNLDPNGAHTGMNAYGYNLNGDYASSMATTQYLTTTAIDCSGIEDVELRFWRWLGVETALYDHANIQVSGDGTNWTTIWTNPGGTNGSISDSAWSQQIYDIHAVADGEATVYIRWGMGTTDSSVTYPGWNIDDVEIWGVTSCTAGTITGQPQSLTRHVGQQAAFGVTATASPAPTYQWRKGGVDIDGATESTYTIDTVALGDAGTYDCVVTNACWSEPSDPAVLTVWRTGDVNCDGVISYGDINPFVVALSGQTSYEAQYPGCNWLNADCNNDGAVTYADINPFVVVLGAGR